MKIQILKKTRKCDRESNTAMAASLILPSSLPPSPPRRFLLQRNRAGLSFSNSVALPSFRAVGMPSQIARQVNRWRPRPGELAVVRAGPPSASTLILVFVLPLSLLIGTIAVSLRIGRKLDEKFLEELAANQAMMEESEGEEDEEGEDYEEGEGGEGKDSDAMVDEEERVLLKEDARTVRIRNRPKRQVRVD